MIEWVDTIGQEKEDGRGEMEWAIGVRERGRNEP